MIDDLIYDQFSENYDRFVNWEGRLVLELPFLISEIEQLRKDDKCLPSVLDVSCGTGRHAIALQKYGFKCSGADISKKMVAIARKNALNAGLETPFRQAGFGELTRSYGKNKFESLLCLGNSLPHVLDEEAMRNTLANFKAVLKPGGKIILQNQNFDRVVKKQGRWMNPETHQEGSNSWIFVRFYDFLPDGQIIFNILILHNENEKGFKQNIISTRLWPFSHLQLVNWLKQSGFEAVNLYGDLQGSAYDVNQSPNLVITALTP